MNLEGKTIVVTGGTSGVGKKIVEKLSEKSQVIVIGRDSKKLESIKSDCNVDTFQADLSNLQDVISACDSIVKKYDEIDVLINNAGVQYTPQFLEDDFQIETVKKEVHTNFTSICYLIYCLMPSLTKKSDSTILNINSGLGLAPKTSSAVYCATKAALNSFSISLRYQLEETNISVLQAFLPLVDTKMTYGRGKGKITADEAASSIIVGLSQGKESNYIGKVKILAFLLRVIPSVARNIMKRW